MSQRILRTVPVALLMTTALAWNLPAAAQGTGSTGPSAGPRPATGAVQQIPAPATARPAGEAAPRGDSGSGNAAFGGSLPADLTPAMPDRPASEADDQGKPGTAPKPSTGTTKP